ncbi:MAG TPA: antibiotic biosynthesis monooxygenase [Gaiellaceae bacterium]|nr:antibiotic biosynthesis monooxygenase [Gaiellaceae bacterium]
MSVYTLGVWTVKEGREDEFVRAWEALGQWTIERGFATHGTLLRDHADRRRYVSFGPWPSVEHAERWRSDPGFQEHLDRILETVESFQPGTYDAVLSVG